MTYDAGDLILIAILLLYLLSLFNEDLESLFSFDSITGKICTS